MKKILSKELILPSFWLFFFIVSPKNEVNVNQLKKESTEVKKQEASGGTNAVNKNKEATFTKAVFLSGF
jgi:hypothetical protein